MFGLVVVDLDWERKFWSTFSSVVSSRTYLFLWLIAIWFSPWCCSWSASFLAGFSCVFVLNYSTILPKYSLSKQLYPIFYVLSSFVVLLESMWSKINWPNNEVFLCCHQHRVFGSCRNMTLTMVKDQQFSSLHCKYEFHNA